MYSEGNPEQEQTVEVKIKIMVTDPIIKDAVQKYVVYTVKGIDKDGPFETYRRFSNFHYLREVLVKRWPGCFIPPIPKKKALGNLEPEFIEERRRHLEKFCFQMAELPHLFYSEEFKIFLRQNNIDLEKVLNTLPSQNAEDLIQKYQLNFKHLSGVKHFPYNTKYIKNNNKILLERNQYRVSDENYRVPKFLEKSLPNDRNTFSNFLLPEYEKNCFTEYTNGNEEKLIYANHNEVKLTYLLNLMKDNHNINCFEELSDLFTAEELDIGAFLEALNQKGFYEQLKDKTEAKYKEQQLDLQKILSGKTTIGSIFSKGSKEDKITNMEKIISNTKTDVENLQFLCDIITVIIGYVEIDRFKFEKQEKYYKLLKYMAQTEIEYARGMQEYWLYLGANKNLEKV